MRIITISRQMGSLGDEIAESLSRKLGWEVISHDRIYSLFLKDCASAPELRMLSESAKFYLRTAGNGETFLDCLKRSLVDYTTEHSAILVGFGSQVIFADSEDALHVRVIAPQNVRVGRIKKQFHMSDAEAGNILVTSDRKHKRFVSVLFGADLTDSTLYNITLNTASLSVYECVNVIVGLLRDLESRQQLDRQGESAGAQSSAAELPVLKNPSEIEFAKILDMYQIDWRYEPKTFPIEWDAAGNVTLAFSPDFYLTKFDTYIELTTMNQKYITTKNRKVKKLRELYPGTNVRIVNKKDFHSLLERLK